MAAAVCICLQSACDSGLLDEPRLMQLAAASELRVRKVTTAVADLMVCKAGSTLAFMLWRGGAAAADTAARVARLAGSFKQAYVLVPHEHLRSPAVLEAAASFGCDEALSFVFLPMGADFAEPAIALATALLPAEAEAALWRTQGSWPFTRRGLAVTTTARRERQPEQQREQQQEQHRQGAQIEAASLRHGPALFAGWTALAGTAASMALARHVPADLVLLVDSTFWLGIVSSISLTEAWVKFRAPLLDRWVGVDVGRRVFRAQFAIEAALAATAFGTMCASGGGLAGSAAALLHSKLLAGAGAALLLDSAVVFPALDVRGRRLIAESAAAPGTASSLSPQQVAYTAALRRSVEGKAHPPAQLHLASVLLAFARAGLLGGFIWQQLMALSGGAPL